MSLRHVVYRPVHKERHQLDSRKHLGLLEKKKDYRQRAAEAHKQKNFTKNLETKAYFKNKQEFNFKMHSTKIRDSDGKLVGLEEGLSKEQKALLNLSDRLYVQNQRQVDMKALEKMQQWQVDQAEGLRTIFDEDGNVVESQQVEQNSALKPDKKTKAKILALSSRVQKLDEIKDVLETKAKLLSSKIPVKKLKSDGKRPQYVWKQQRQR